jgi:Glycoside hydrolase family 2 C-terminal domain 5
VEGSAPTGAAIAADGDDLSFVTVRVEDKDGNFCPTADNLVKFALEGPANIAGVDNGTPPPSSLSRPATARRSTAWRF